MIELSIDPKFIIQNKIFQFVLAYIFALQIIASQTKDEPSIFKNIIFRIIINTIVFLILDYSLITSLTFSLILTTFFFGLVEK
jgi:TATA-box binding protein (TBP) (component of TFIID and TFIIIB)